ncbi:MAG: DUF2635 domain-containing protein [Rhodocyclaceae bacterium]|nr:DUF2635 domain-containing protein [Rhodocyclaceae bacterium]
MQVKATPINGARVRKPDGSILQAEGEPVERSSYWLRRENDGDVTLEAITDAAPTGVTEPAAPAVKPKK